MIGDDVLGGLLVQNCNKNQVVGMVMITKGSRPAALDAAALSASKRWLSYS